MWNSARLAGRRKIATNNPGCPVNLRAFFALLGFGAVWLTAIWLVATARGQQPNSPMPAVRFANGGNAAEVPLELASNAVFVPVRMDGRQPSNWLLDTASARTAAGPLDGSPGSEADATINSATLTLPGVSFREPDLIVHSFEPLGPWYGLRVGGVLGDDVLAGLVVELDYERLSIELYDAGSYRQPGHMQKLAIRWVHGLPTIRAKARLGGQTITGDFVLNTAGSSGILVFRSFLSSQRMLHMQGKTIPGEAVDASGAQAVTLMRGESVEIGSFRVSQPIVSISGQSESSAAFEKLKGDSAAGWIGGAILRKFRVVLDFPENCIFIAPNRDFVFPMQADASGATITAAGAGLNQFEVRSVQAGSPAAQAGLEPGDRIVLIDGEEASDFSLDQIRDLLRQANHSPVLVVERLGGRVRIDLRLQPAL